MSRFNPQPITGEERATGLPVLNQHIHHVDKNAQYAIRRVISYHEYKSLQKYSRSNYSLSGVYDRLNRLNHPMRELKGPRPTRQFFQA